MRGGANRCTSFFCNFRVDIIARRAGTGPGEREAASGHPVAAVHHHSD